MRKILNKISVPFLVMFFSLTVNSCNDMNIIWKELPPLPPAFADTVQPGVAGPYTGIHRNTLIIAGGANFPDSMPWLGGKKKFCSDVYALQLSPDGGTWINPSPEASMKMAVAYGTSVSVPAGVVCMGGEIEGGLTDTVFVISASGDRLLFTPLPSLPFPLTNAASAAIGSKIYITGGISPEGPSKTLLSLDTQNASAGWDRLSDMPMALINSVMVAVGDKEKDLWIMGGRTREPNSDTSVIRSEIFRYSVADDRWDYEGMISDGSEILSLAAGTGAAVNDKYIILFGGNEGTVFTRVEKLLSEMAREKDPLIFNEKRLQYVSLQESHPGFSGIVILFDTENRKCRRIGEIPGHAQVTTIAVPTPYGIVIPSGEIRPGVRTPVILAAGIK